MAIDPVPEQPAAEATDPAVDAVPVVPAIPPDDNEAFAFTGRAADYFRIWVVNLLLVLLTLGLWSPWAKVRKRRYFYGHTWVAGANFDYHGDPVAILRGRLLAVAAFGVYWFVDHLWPAGGPWLLLSLVCGVPWIVTRSLTFNAVNSSYRGIRFGFHCKVRTVAAALSPILLWPLSVLLARQDPLAMLGDTTLYTAASFAVYGVLVAIYPYVVARVRRLTVGHATWGQCAFASELKTRKVYGIYLIGGLLGSLILGVLAGGVGGFLGAGMAGADWARSVLLTVFTVALVIAYALGIAIFASYTRARMSNLIFNTARLEGVGRFNSTLRARRLASLYFSNLMAIVASCGLLIPWAVIRVARYRAESLSLVAQRPIDQVAAGAAGAAGATGEELAEVFGFDLAL